MTKIRWRLAVLKSIFTPFAILVLATPAIAQSIVPATDGTNTIVTPEGDRIDITGGQISRDGVNLFHSFTRFGLSAEQIANFLSQPNIQNILARINGGEASFINGLIQVTGGNSNLFLINPAGIIFGSNASLNVPASFLATTANGIGFNNNWFNVIGNNNYADLVGKPNAFAFTMSQPGTILNVGNLAVGIGQDLTLLAGTIVNTGTLSAPSGNITLAAVPGQSIVRLSQPGFVLNLEIQPVTIGGNQPQNWTLPILSLPQLLTGGNGGHATGVTVNTDGTVELTGSGIGIPTAGKTTIVSGNINVSGKTGGTVNILGDKVGIVSGNIIASGTNGGGNVLIGGDYQGKGIIPNASRTYVSSDSVISVDSFVAGKGGSAIVWADKVTGFYGSISAKGGSNSGDGGFVEVSGKDTLIFAGKVDTTAANGKLGALLLDPINITIVDGTQAPDDVELEDRQIFQADNFSTSFTVSETALENLAADANIILEATNNITINNLADNTLNLKATTGSITFKSDADLDGVGSFSMDATDSIETKGGAVAISGKDLTVGAINTNGGNIALNATEKINAGLLDSSNTSNNGGNITIKSINDILIGGIKSKGLLDGGNVILTSNDGAINTSAGDIDTGTENFSTGNSGIVILNAKGNITTASIQTDVGFKSTGNAGNISLTSIAGAIDISKGDIDAGTTFGNGGTVEIKAAGNITTGRIVSYVVNQGKGNSGNISITSTGGSIDTTKNQIQNLESILDSRSESGNGGNITLKAAGDITALNITSLSITNGSGGDVSFTTSGGNIAIAGAIDARSKDGTATGNGGDIALSAAGNITPGGLDTSSTKNGDGGNITVKAGGNIIGAVDTNSGAINGKGGDITFQAGGNIIADDIFSFGSQGGGNIELISDSKIDLTDVTQNKDPEATPGTIISCSGSDSNCNGSGTGGNITLKAANDIVVGGISSSGFLAGGNISINSGGSIEAKIGVNQQGKVFGGFLDTSSKNGAAGAIALDAPDSITTGDINAVGLPNTGNISLTSNKIDFTGGNDGIPIVAGKGTILLQPFTPSQNLTLTPKDFAALQDGFSSITIGRDNGSGIITVSEPISVSDPLTIQSPLGSILVNGAIAGKDNASITLNGNTTLNASITTADQNLTINGNTTLGNNITLSTGATGGGDISINGTIDGNNNLALETGTGNIILNGAVGSNTRLGNFTINSAGNVQTQSITSASIAQIAGIGTTTLGSLNTNTAAGISLTGNIFNLNGDIDTTNNGELIVNNNSSLNIAATRNINLDGAFNQIGAGDVFTAGNITTTNNDIRFSGSVTLTGNATFNPGTGAIAFNSTLNAQTNPLTLTASEIDFGGAVSGTNTLVLQPATQAQNITIAGSIPGALNLTAAEIANLQDGFSSITIGREDGTGTIAVNNATFNDPIIIRGGLGAISLNGTIIGRGNASIALDAATTTLNGNVTTTNQNITVGRNVVLGSDVTLTGGNIIFNGAVNGKRRLILNADGNIQFGAGAGLETPLSGLEISRAQTIFIAKGIAANSDLAFNSPIVLTEDTSFNTGAGNANITFNSSINSEVNEANSLIVTTGGNLQAGDITTNGGAIALTSRSTIVQTGNLNSSGVTSGGNITVSAFESIRTGTINSSSTNGNGGNVTLDPENDIEVVSINAQGGNQGGGGIVDITTERFFRATGTFTDRNGINSSISTAGGTANGSVIIRHDGGDRRTTFNVGDASINGTAGAITTGANNSILPLRIFPGRYTQDIIQIITSDRLVIELYGSTIKRENPPIQEEIGQILRVPIDTVVGVLEETFTRQYEAYLGLRPPIIIKTIEEIRAQLREAEKATGVKTAIVYIAFGRGELGIEALLASQQLVDMGLEATALKQIIAQLVNPNPSDRDPVELVLVTAEGEPMRWRVEGVARSQILAVANQFRTEIEDDEKVGTNSYEAPAKQLYQWLIAPLNKELQIRGIKQLVFIPDVGLRAIPIAALYDGQQFIVEQYSVSLMPSFSLTNPRYFNLKNASVLAMGASEFTGLSPLPAVPVELRTITPGLWPGKTGLNEAFTVDNLKFLLRSQSYEIVHLATHANFESGPQSNSYIQFWDTQLRLDQVKEMQWNDPPVHLLALSACNTATGDREVELGFAGLAVQTGVNSALASLWYVKDEGTLGLMTEFYEQLKTAQNRAEALQQAQIAMIQQQVYLEGGKLYGAGTWGIPLPPVLLRLGDKSLSDPHYWAAFTMIGNPW